MIIRVDGHEIPILTALDLTAEQRAVFKKPVHTSVENGA